jgi:DNA-binding protein Alba
MAEEAVILVGKKPLMNYVLAATMPLADGKKVVLKARGRAISRAVDIAEIIKRRFVQNAVYEKINIGTEEGRVGTDNRPRNVSTIEIVVSAPSEKSKKSK